MLEGTPDAADARRASESFAPGDVAHFPRGADGAHQVRNDAPTAGALRRRRGVTTPEIVEYPDTGKIAAMAKTPSRPGRRSGRMHFLENARRLLGRRTMI